MLALIKIGLLLGLVLGLGAGIFARFIAPSPLSAAAERRLRIGLWLGVALLAVTSLLEVAETLRQIFGAFELELYLDYLTTSRQGSTVLVRLGLLVPLLLLGPIGGRRVLLDRGLYVAVTLALLVTVSRVSHSGALGWLPLFGDLGHVIAATIWGGPLLYAAWLPVWMDPAPPLKTLLARLSFVGLTGVLLLVASGIYASTLHLVGVGSLTQTAYGGTLSLKLVLVAVILALAAGNRWSLLPAVRRVAVPTKAAVSALRRTVRIESLVLIAVFAVTGMLGTREPPNAEAHSDHGLAGLFGLHDEHAEELALLQSGPIVVGLTTDPDTAMALLIVRLQEEGTPLEGATVLLLDDDDDAADWQELAPLKDLPGFYGTIDFVAPEFGDWRVSVGIDYPDGRQVRDELPVLPFGTTDSTP